MQQRIGKDGKAFRMYKFRSMVVNAEEMLKELQSKNEASGPVFKIENDPGLLKSGVLLESIVLMNFLSL